MAKAATKSNKPVIVTSTQVPATAKLSDEEVVARFGGVGVSTDAADNLVPMMTILQGQSPQVLKKNEAYVKDAEAGDILLKNAPDPLVKGDEGFLFQPCHYSYDWVLWRPRKAGGGFMGRHSSNENNPPKGAKQVEDENERLVWKDGHGNEWIFTRYFSGFVLRDVPMPFVIPFKSTGHTVAKTWMFALNNMILPDVKPPTKAPIFAGIWRCTTKHRTNADGDWYVLEPTLERMYNPRKELADYERGERLRMSFMSGERKMEDPEDDGAVRGRDVDGEM